MHGMLSAPGHGGAESTSRAPCNALAKDQKRIKEKDLQASFKNKSTSKTRNKSNTQAAIIQFLVGRLATNQSASQLHVYNVGPPCRAHSLAENMCRIMSRAQVAGVSKTSQVKKGFKVA